MPKLLFYAISLMAFLLFYATEASFFPKEIDNSTSPLDVKSIIGCSPQINIAVSLKTLEEILPNDNRLPAGKLINKILYLSLEARTGHWYPETHEGIPIKVHAFAEVGKPLQLPGPLIRVPAGTEIRVTVRNLILDSPLVLHGFFERPLDQRDSIVIPYGKTYSLQFKAGAAGTYFYRATAGDRKQHGLPYYTDSQLYGALIIDPQNTKPHPNERIFMIGIWNDTLTGTNLFSNEELVLNGLSWPYTERLTYKQNEPVNWRVINASNQAHPMHLHGFYFTLISKGNAYRDAFYKNESRPLEVTQLIQPHETMMIRWIPEKPGNWLFHCHTLVHIMPFSFLRTMPKMTEFEMNDVSTHAHNGMGGLMLGIHVLPAGKIVKGKIIKSERELTLIAQEEKSYFGRLPGKGFLLVEENVSNKREHISIPGPPIILVRNQPVAIKVINKLHEPTTVHWHGLEIESYFDGAAGWGNRVGKLTPLILAGSSFVAHLIPPRAGTFIYHTHMHDEQLVSGMYGPLIVLEPGQEFNPVKDKIFLMGSAPPLEPPLVMLNGKSKPDTMHLIRGTSYRLRLINITALNPDLEVSLLFKGAPVRWTAISKDGADLPPQQIVTIPAASQQITIGETRDFEFEPGKAGSYFFEVRSAYGGELLASMILEVC
jgi:manganese oxidase